MNSILLSQLTAKVEEALSLNFSKAVWVHAEISELRENNGHCYMELIEKSEENDSIVAKCRATCWASTYRMLKPYFESTTGQYLASGLQILVSVTIDFHSVYGLNLNVRDIDPVYTVGEMAAKRAQIIRRLEEEGIADMNKQLPFPALAQRIAIISSPTAAGYEDFLNQIRHNSFGFRFYTKLFSAVMQGEAAEASIISALDKIYEEAGNFDAVVIIRGGGAAADLAAFDSYLLALNCVQFPLPVISGIGHQRDVSVLDIVAHTSVKTPTAAAEFLIDNLYEAETQVMNIYSDIQYTVREYVNNARNELIHCQFELKNLVRNLTGERKYKLETAKRQLKGILKIRFLQEHSKIEALNSSIGTHSPEFLLKYGYTITTSQGKRITSVKDITAGSDIKTYAGDGLLESKVTAVLEKLRETAPSVPSPLFSPEGGIKSDE